MTIEIAGQSIGRDYPPFIIVEMVVIIIRVNRALQIVEAAASRC